MEEYIIKKRKDGSVVTVRSLQLVLLEMLKDIDKLCRNHHIPYFMSGGSCLGAVRHQGFIPWDDDADICMMREDYLAFQKVVNELGDKYYTQDFDHDTRYNVAIPAMKIRLRGTYCKEVNFMLENRCEGDGVFIDVFIADYVSETKSKDRFWRCIQIFLMVFITIFEVLHINPVALKRLFVKIARSYGVSNKDSSLIGYELTWTFDLLKKPIIYKKDDIYPVQYVPFEDTTLPIPRIPKSLLDVEVGTTYMSYPPKKEQEPKHLVDLNLNGENKIN
ncbi:MAG: LicD family protein [Erysipelotrichaceae bacterium]